LAGDEGMSLSSSDSRLGSERNKSSDDELESGEEELVVSFSCSGEEAIEVYR